MIGTTKAHILIFIFFSLFALRNQIRATPLVEIDGIDPDRSDLSLVTFPIPGLIDSQRRGPFIELLRELEQRSGRKIFIDVLPPKRATKYFLAGKYDAMFPALLAKLPKNFPYCRSDLIYMKKDFLFYRQTHPISWRKTQEKIHIGLVSGYITPLEKDFISKNITFEKTMNMLANMRKLLSGRIDAVISEEFEALAAIKALKATTQISYDPDQSLHSAETYIIFQKKSGLDEVCKEFFALSQKLRSEKWLEQRIKQRFAD
ncbi:MAG: hypothetical protein ACOH5I_14370 [Oligoflexus sp.]